MAVLRSVLAVAIGFVFFGILISAFDALAAVVGGQPSPKSVEEYKLNYESYPTTFYLTLMLGWSVAAFGGSSVATLIASRWKWIHGAIIGGIGLLATILNLYLIPHPTWVNLGIIPIPLLIAASLYLFGRSNPQPAEN